MQYVKKILPLLGCYLNKEHPVLLVTLIIQWRATIAIWHSAQKATKMSRGFAIVH